MQPKSFDCENKIMTEKTITVELGPRSYDVRIGPGMIDKAGQTVAALGNVSQAVVIADATVAELYGQQIMESLSRAGVPAKLIDFPAGESHKSLATYGRVMEALLALTPAIDWASVVVALGGGVAGDLAGFVAATALRGLRWIQCPTTVLADVDASVGGKTAVDSTAGKNLIGAFHQPSGVLIDVTTLKTLDELELRSGLAECVKHGVIRDASLLDFIAENIDAILACEPEVMTDLLARNVAIKAAVVSADERESGERAHLNFGHTIGHAIESFLGLGTITHGQAVSLGMVAANNMSIARGMLGADQAQQVAGLLDTLALPTRWSALDAPRIWQIMQHDKKTVGGRVRMILAESLGTVAIFDDITEDAVAQAVASLDANGL